MRVLTPTAKMHLIGAKNLLLAPIQRNDRLFFSLNVAILSS
ncbi:hypothetical protein HMPREF1567_3090 [Providencia alcalifaciens PAL-2]|uniref:Uncharacterized protein n=2 Tax=Providencia alcalifaciens TaxID=126385 RepID=B6XH38_9GAMM|nr:hypothetical protein PROVALCAL_02676 [Providencia alcalifaciens DSM 30120]ETT09258.1 hypothetical protein HMPREF1562_2747 [Providencia alcalifaciens F90-2004]EUC97606.1 hypothetical protein HMPREF1567_3090 [Providencia alcalifaciens PAL-2]EUD07340.1 hypothetical protein HMPREF1564_1860 [Providencia alcalifaciens R90-1475]EUD12845.1 hypothetical protein HMPREF1563_1070 [Providencia alcalifaciens 205/92]